MSDTPTIRAVVCLGVAPGGRTKSGTVYPGALQVSVSAIDANGVGHGRRLIGPKLLGVSTTLAEVELDATDVAEIRRILDEAFPALAAAMNGEGMRLSRIAEAHSKNLTAGGMTSGDCDECGWSWPCPTYVWATTDREYSSVWNPADDELVAAMDAEDAAAEEAGRG